MKMFFRRKKETDVKSADADMLNFLKEYTLHLESLRVQQRITEEQYQKELKGIDTELRQMEDRYESIVDVE